MALDCYDCLKRLIVQGADLATKDGWLRRKAVERAMNILESEFSYYQISIVVATKIHDEIKNITGNTDPYRAMKEKEMPAAWDWKEIAVDESDIRDLGSEKLLRMYWMMCVIRSFEEAVV